MTVKTIFQCQDHDRLGCPQCATELYNLREFVKSLNSFAFEEWHGHYQIIGGYDPYAFHILNGEGKSVASGKDALDAWQNFVACLPEEGDDD